MYAFKKRDLQQIHENIYKQNKRFDRPNNDGVIVVVLCPQWYYTFEEYVIEFERA